MTNTFDWIEIRTHDIDLTAAFYESLFDWKVNRRETAGGAAVWIFDTGDQPRLENLRRGGIWLRPPGDPLGLVVYILVNDIESTLNRIIEFGGKVVTQKAPVGAGYAAYFTDPNGNLLALYQDRITP